MFTTVLHSYFYIVVHTRRGRRNLKFKKKMEFLALCGCSDILVNVCNLYRLCTAQSYVRHVAQTANKIASFTNNFKVQQSPYRPWEFLKFEDPIIQDNWHINEVGCQPYAPATFTLLPPPSKYSRYSCMLEDEPTPRAIVRPAGISQWTRDLLGYNAEHQPTASSRNLILKGKKN